MNFFRDLTGFSILLKDLFFFCSKKLGVIWKVVFWLAQLSTLLSDEPKYRNIWAKSRYIFLTVALTVSVWRGKGVRKCADWSPPEFSCGGCWDEQTHSENYKAYDTQATGLIQADVDGLLSQDLCNFYFSICSFSLFVFTFTYLFYSFLSLNIVWIFLSCL